MSRNEPHVGIPPLSPGRHRRHQLHAYETSGGGSPNGAFVQSFSTLAPIPRPSTLLAARLSSEEPIRDCARCIRRFHRQEQLRDADMGGGCVLIPRKCLRIGSMVADPPGDEPFPWVEPELEPELRRLSERQRTAVVLRHSSGCSYAEMSQVMGVLIPTVQKHVDRALGKRRQ